jgi:hypothetical protein
MHWPTSRTGITALALALGCAGPRAGAVRAPLPAPDCDGLRDETVRACVAGFQARRAVPEDDEELELALGEVCPYAGAVAWSGCHRGAFRRFESRGGQGPCAEQAAYVESAIQTSCMRPVDLPLSRWNELVRRCFDWAEAGRDDAAAACRSKR